MTKPKSELPEPERLVKLHCHDWSPYTCVGKFVKYKPGSGKRTGRSRFMKQESNGTFSTDKDSWIDCETWEYL